MKNLSPKTQEWSDLKELAEQGSISIVEGNSLNVRKLTTPEAGRFFAAGTSVSLSDQGMFELYHKDGGIFFVQDGKDRYFAHPQVGIIDANDQVIKGDQAKQIESKIPEAALQAHPELAKALRFHEPKAKAKMGFPHSMG